MAASVRAARAGAADEPRAAAAGHPLPGPPRLGARRQVPRDHPRHEQGRRGLPDGGTFTLNTNPKLNHNVPFVDLDTAFATFGPKTQQGLRERDRRVRRRGRRPRHPVQRRDLLAAAADRPAREPAARRLRPAAPGCRSSSAGWRGRPARSPPSRPTISSLLVRRRHHASGGRRARRSVSRSTSLPPTESLGTTVLTNARPVLDRCRHARAGAEAVGRAAPDGRAGASTRSSPAPRRCSGAPRHSPTALETALRGRRRAGQGPRVDADVHRSSARATWPRSAPRRSSASARSCAQRRHRAVRLQHHRAVGPQLPGRAQRGRRDRARGCGSRRSSRATRCSPRARRRPTSTSTRTRWRTRASARPATRCYAGTQPIGDPGKTSTTVDNTAPPRGRAGRGQEGGAGAMSPIACAAARRDAAGAAAGSTRS